MQKDFLTFGEISFDEIKEVFALSEKLKKERAFTKDKPLAGKSVGMIFSKSSTRTRLSFEVGIHELGAYPVFMDQSKLQMGRGETIADTARVMSRYLHAVVIRTYGHDEVVEFAKYANMPVINALTDDYHPCQILTDIFTVYEYSKRIEGIKMVFLGDGSSNMANSLMLAAHIAGFELVIAAPEKYKPRADLMTMKNSRGKVVWEQDPKKAVENADYLYTDVWVSMGFEKESAERLTELASYQLDMKLLKAAKPDARVLHCLPAHRGEEITDDVIESSQSIVFDQAENRLHVQKAIMSMMIK